MITARMPVASSMLGIGAAVIAAALAAVPVRVRAAAPAPANTEHVQPITVQDLVRLQRVSDLAASPDGKHLAYTVRTTDMEANTARTTVWLADTGARTRRVAAAAVRLTDIAANSSAAAWSTDGRYIYFLSNRSGSNQVWRVAGEAPGAAAPGAAAQVESMVRCGHCGLHLPASESIKDEAGTAYCSEQHRREHAP